tara:strand:- start:107 stop:568 length:462 start_codon:yes stop_codon:yes gene_type:complete
MASTISAATLTVTHTEALTLNGVDRGVTNTLTIASINEVDHRILTVDTSAARTIATLGTTVGSGEFIKGNVKYIRVTNKDDTNYVTLGLIQNNTGTEATHLKLEAGQSFVIYNDDIDIRDDAIAFSGSFVELKSISAQANSANVDVELFVAST